MTDDLRRDPQAHAAPRHPRRTRRQDRAVRRLRDAGPVPDRHHRRAQGGARSAAGCSTSSHMGEFIVRGAGAVDFVNHVTTNDVAALAVGQVHYSTILNERGTIEDDCLVYRFADHLMMVVNASNAAEGPRAHRARMRRRSTCTHRGRRATTSRCSRVQGPKAARDPAAAHRRRPLDDQVLPLRRGRGRRRAGRDHLAHRLHRRGRLRAVLRRTTHAAAHLERAHGHRPGHARRTRRARLAAPRDGHGALRQRHRRHRHAARGEPRLAREAREGRLRRPRRARQAEGARASRASSSASRSPSAPSRATATRCSTTASRAASCAAAR